MIEIKHKVSGAVLHRHDGADLRGADLRGANLYGANLYGADLRGAKNLLDAGTPYDWPVVAVPHTTGVMIAAGCQWFTFKEATAHWKNRKDRTLMVPLLAYIKAAAKLRKWKL